MKQQPESKTFLTWLPWIGVVLCAVYLFSKTRPASYGDHANITGFSKLMVSLDGRTQPLDSVARNSLLVISRVSTFKSDFLRPHQVKDWRGLADAILNAKGESAAYIQSLLTDDQRVLLRSVKDSDDELIDKKQVHLLEMLNHLLDDVRREAQIKLHNATAGESQQLIFKPFYNPKTWTDVELDPEREFFRKRFEEYQEALAEQDKARQAKEKAIAEATQKLIEAGEKDQAAADALKAAEAIVIEPIEPNTVVSQPEIIEFNRVMLGEVFDDFVSSGSAKREPAVVWLLDTLARPRYAEQHRVFRIVHPGVLSFLGLPERKRFRYAFSEFRDSFDKLEAEAAVTQTIKSKDRDPYQKGIVDAYGQVQTYRSLKHGWRPYWQPPIALNGEWTRIKDEVNRAEGQIGEGIRSNPEVLAHFQKMGERPKDQDINLALAKFNLMPTDDTQRVGRMLLAYQENDIATFNTLVKAHTERFEKVEFGGQPARARYEVFFNQFDVFYHCIMMYVMAFLCVVFSWLFAHTRWREPLRKTGYYILLFTLVAHTYGIISRMYLHERPPITNLYATGIFIGWAAAFVAVIIERITKLGFGIVVAALIGSLTGIVSTNLAADGDTLEMQQAVLDTNFWLATHVTAINIGYMGTFLAGALGIIFVLGGVFTRGLNKETRKILTQMTYGVVCFALFFSFVGTVLGGIWADQSWGRFWGWDPKENGALLIVIANALVLHARWAGLARERGIANLAIFGNIVTCWSWFGTNQLGVGLHSYGFTESATFYIIVFTCSQLVIMGIGMTPLNTWRSYSDQFETRKATGIPGMITGATMSLLFFSLIAISML